MPRLINKTKDRVLAENVIFAHNILGRAKGLIGCKNFPFKQALWIKPCRGGVHTFFMSFPIDLIFVDSKLAVCSVFFHIRPWKMVNLFSFAPRSVFELRAPSLKQSFVQKGDELYVGA